MRKALLVALCLGIGIYCFGQSKVLAIIGSSTAAGTGASSPDSSYVGRLNYYYNNLGIQLTVHNLAVGGYNCFRGLPTSYINDPPPPPFELLDVPYPNNNATKALSFAPDVVIVGYPSNFYQLPTWTVAKILEAHQIIYDSVVAAGKICYITTPQPRQDGGTFGTPELRQKLKDIRDAMMVRFGNYAIDFWTGIALPDNTINPIYSAGDNIHLNNAGHKELFKRVRDKNIFGFGRINRAIANGNWDNPLIWENEYVPTIADSVAILPGRTITINANVDVRALNVHSSAGLTITQGRTLKIGN